MSAVTVKARFAGLPDAKVKIILAAESLFAERGIEAVSLREIAVAAGHGNNNAVKYHFDTKDGLVHAIFVHRVAAMDESRTRRLADAEAKGMLCDMRTLLEIQCLPILDLVDEEGRHTYAAFMNQYLTRYRPAGIRHAADDISIASSTLRRLMTLIEQRVSYVPSYAAQSRIALCYLMFTSMLVRFDHDKTSAKDSSQFPLLLNDTLEIMTTALCAPHRGSTVLSG